MPTEKKIYKKKFWIRLMVSCFFYYLFIYIFSILIYERLISIGRVSPPTTTKFSESISIGGVISPALTHKLLDFFFVGEEKNEKGAS